MSFRLIIISLYFAFSCNHIFSQSESIRSNSIYVQAYTIRNNYSIHYDRIIIHKNFYWLSAQVGYIYGKVTNASNTYYNNGVELNPNILFGRRSSHIELGCGIWWLYKNINYTNPNYRMKFSRDYIAFNIGYRFQKTNGRFFLKTGIYFTEYFYTKYYYNDSPFQNSEIKGFYPSIFLGLGISF